MALGHHRSPLLRHRPPPCSPKSGARPPLSSSPHFFSPYTPTATIPPPLLLSCSSASPEPFGTSARRWSWGRRLRTHHQFAVKAASSAPAQTQIRTQLGDNHNSRTEDSPSSDAPAAASSSAVSFRSREPKDVTVVVTGSTGYIGKFVVRELVRRGFNVVAVARERSGIRGRNGREKTLEELPGATVCFSDVTDLDTLQRSLEGRGGAPVDVVVCCLASRSGGIKDSWRIDYGATKNSLVAGRGRGAAHFVLLSAICVQKPLLEFQRAKLKFEAELEEAALSGGGSLTYSIVRPTAFFKSLAGQVEIVKDGKPYVMFGDGKLCACKPISEEDLASFVVDCVMDEDKINKILPIGGPGEALTPLEQGEMLFRLLGKEPKFLKVPIAVMDFAIGVLDFLVKIFPSLEDAAEFGKIGRYYAVESMLVLDPETGEYSAEKTPSYGSDTLEEFFKRVIREGMAGQELGEQSIF